MSVNNVLSLHCVAAGNNYCEGIVMTTSEVQRKKSNVGQVINTVVIVVR